RGDDNKETPIEKQADVKIDGKVSVNGKPLATGKVLLTLAGNHKGVEASVNGGKFQIGQVAPGTYRVAIQSADAILPGKYNHPDQSGLMIEASVGKNTFEF